jgi:hypothetical protein
MDGALWMELLCHFQNNHTGLVRVILIERTDTPQTSKYVLLQLPKILLILSSNSIHR